MIENGASQTGSIETGTGQDNPKNRFKADTLTAGRGETAYVPAYYGANQENLHACMKKQPSGPVLAPSGTETHAGLGRSAAVSAQQDHRLPFDCGQATGETATARNARTHPVGLKPFPVSSRLGPGLVDTHFSQPRPSRRSGRPCGTSTPPRTGSRRGSPGGRSAPAASRLRGHTT